MLKEVQFDFYLVCNKIATLKILSSPEVRPPDTDHNILTFFMLVKNETLFLVCKSSDLLYLGYLKYEHESVNLSGGFLRAKFERPY